MAEKLHAIAYFSQSVICEPHRLNREVETILQTARANNQGCDVTGVLLYSHGFFAQVIEGPFTAVETTFEKICRDARHGHVSLLRRHGITRRSFSDWSMAFGGLNPEAPECSEIDAMIAGPCKNNDGGRFSKALQNLIWRSELCSD